MFLEPWGFGARPSCTECDWRNINLPTKRLAQRLRTNFRAVRWRRQSGFLTAASWAVSLPPHSRLRSYKKLQKGSKTPPFKSATCTHRAPPPPPPHPHQFPKKRVMARTFKFIIIRCDLHGSKPKRSWQRESCLLSIPTAWTGKRRSGSPLEKDRILQRLDVQNFPEQRLEYMPHPSRWKACNIYLTDTSQRLQRNIISLTLTYEKHSTADIHE